MARKTKVRQAVETANAVAETVTAAVGDAVDQVKEAVSAPKDERGYVHESSKELGSKQGRGRLYYLVREWIPTIEQDMSKRRPHVKFVTGSGAQHRSDRCHIPDGCRIVEGAVGVPRLYSSNIGSAIKNYVLSGMSREEAWSRWEAENAMKREESGDWDSYKSSRPGKKVQQVVWLDMSGKQRDPKDARLT